MSKIGSRERRANNVDRILAEIGLPPTALPLEKLMSLAPVKNIRQRGPDGKVMFPSEASAKASARNILTRKSGNVSSLRTYFCPDCHAWHMSSSFHR